MKGGTLTMTVVIKDCAYILVHVPDFVRYGSKPSRDITTDGRLLEKLSEHLRSYQEAVSYPPNQIFIGNGHPDDLNEIPQPWYKNPMQKAKRQGVFGEIMPEREFYGWLKIADDFDLVWLDSGFVNRIREDVASHPLLREGEIEKLGKGVPIDKVNRVIQEGSALPLFFEGKVVGSLRRDHDRDDTLKAEVLMENLLSKASGSLVMRYLLKRSGTPASEVDFVFDCTETAVGDRYNRGGGSLSKAMAEMTGCINATGQDVRAFCCAPVHAIISACGTVESGIFKNVIVAGGGCLAKVGMKYSSHLSHDMPILEDVIGGIAFLITKDDGVSPKVRLDCVGKHEVGAGSSQEAIMRSLIVKPLNRIGLKMTEIDKYATELHNPEVTLPAGSGNTPLTNYRIMGALAALGKEIDRADIDGFVKKHGMPGYSPTQGHIPSAVPFLGHALESMRQGKMKRTMFVAKGSLFLGRMSQLSDGVSFLLEANSR
jgi:betaine reductase